MEYILTEAGKKKVAWFIKVIKKVRKGKST